MRYSATDIGAKGFDEDTGFGLLNVPAALSQTAPPIDPHEPNEDINEITAGGLFAKNDTPVTSPGHGRASFRARLDVTEDPEDVYRVWVPPHRRVTIRVIPTDDVDVELWDPSSPSVHITGADKAKHLIDSSTKSGPATEIVSVRNSGSRGAFTFLDVYLPQNGPNAAVYRVAITTSR
jgi:hypothetical protein